MSQQHQDDPFAFIEVQVADCETANPDPIVFTHQLPPITTTERVTAVLSTLHIGSGSGGGMVPPTESDDDSSSLSGSCSTDDDSREVAAPHNTHHHLTSHPTTRGTTATTTNRASRYAAYQQEGEGGDTTTTTIRTEPSKSVVVKEDISGLVSLDDLPEPTLQNTTNPTDTSTPFERAPLEASKLTADDRRKLSVEEQRAKEEAATIKRCAELLTSSHNPTNNNNNTTTTTADTELAVPLDAPEELAGPDIHYSSPTNNEALPVEMLLDTGRFNEGVPLEVRDGCRGALEAIMAAYR